MRGQQEPIPKSRGPNPNFQKGPSHEILKIQLLIIIGRPKWQQVLNLGLSAISEVSKLHPSALAKTKTVQEAIGKGFSKEWRRWIPDFRPIPDQWC